MPRLRKFAAFLGCCLLCQVLHAQLKSDSAIQQPRRKYSESTIRGYIYFPVNVSVIFLHNTAALHTHLNYTATDVATGTKTQQTFTNTNTRFFTGNETMVNLLAYTHVWYKSVCTAQLGLVTNSARGGGFNLGYGYILPVYFNHNMRPAILVTPGLSMYYTDFYSALGTLDNEGKTLDFLGFTANNQFKATTGGRYAHTQTYDAKEVQVNFEQISLAAIPQLQISIPHQGAFFCGVSVGWHLPFATGSRIKFFQEADGNKADKLLGHTGLYNLQADYDGQPVTQSPYSFKGLFANFNAGFIILPARHRNRNKHNKTTAAVEYCNSCSAC